MSEKPSYSRNFYNAPQSGISLDKLLVEPAGTAMKRVPGPMDRPAVAPRRTRDGGNCSARFVPR